MSQVLHGERPWKRRLPNIWCVQSKYLVSIWEATWVKGQHKQWWVGVKYWFIGFLHCFTQMFFICMHLPGSSHTLQWRLKFCKWIDSMIKGKQFIFLNEWFNCMCMKHWKVFLFKAFGVQCCSSLNRGGQQSPSEELRAYRVLGVIDKVCFQFTSVVSSKQTVWLHLSVVSFTQSPVCLFSTK